MRGIHGGVEGLSWGFSGCRRPSARGCRREPPFPVKNTHPGGSKEARAGVSANRFRAALEKRRRFAEQPGESPNPALLFNVNPNPVCRRAVRPARRDAGRSRPAEKALVPASRRGFDGYSSTFREPPSRPTSGSALTCGNVGRRPRSTRGAAESTRISEKNLQGRVHINRFILSQRDLFRR